jgi:hypothetical protein
VIEILNFRLVPGADEGGFLAADKRVQSEFAYQQPGLMRRTTARGDDGEWVVIDLWQSLDQADACNAKWGLDEVTQEFMAFVDEASVRTSRFYERE